ncbi:MAG: isocitrate/isopropylmalate family dehydrogenase [Chloroflexi bacterium]|nr:isocitrate/isopropylmalate family dehydrogenase [Chloroflexota bacterium]MDA1174562.1 isocitrate/isopropylmalate family dehydrogenase [Chloroflexota bacterium]
MTNTPDSAQRTHNVVVIKGDGIGPELVDASLVVLDAVQQRTGGFKLAIDFRDGGAELYKRAGHNLAPETLEAIKQADATMKGPVGLPEVRFPDGTEAGVLGGVLRMGLDTYANDRPIRLLPGVNAPIKAEPGEIDYIIVRENTEGMYLARGKGIGTDDAVADTMLITRKGTERIVRHAFEIASARNGAPSDGVRRVTCVDKSNVLASMAFFRRVFDEIADQYPDIEREYLYSDAAAQALVMQPQHFDVLVMENFLGDMLSDLGGGTIGGVGLCPSGNIGDTHAYFEPIHGSAPSIAGQDKANPTSQILTLALMLDHLGERAAGDAIRSAVSRSLETGTVKLNELGQPVDGTHKAAEAIAAAVSAG